MESNYRVRHVRNQSSVKLFRRDSKEELRKTSYSIDLII